MKQSLLLGVVLVQSRGVLVSEDLGDLRNARERLAQRFVRGDGVRLQSDVHHLFARMRN